MTTHQESKEKPSDKKIVSHGVEALIERLKNNGVRAGKEEAESIVKQAQKQADQILNDAHKETKQLLTKAHTKIEQEKQAALDALQLAGRNMRIELRQRFIDRFKEEIKRLVHQALTNEATIRQLVLLLTAETAEQIQKFKASEIEIQLPATVLNFDQIRKNPKLLENDPLKQLVQGATSQILREGMTLTINTDHTREVGITVRIVNEDIEMDLSEAAINALILKHLQPRLRALLEGLLV